MERTIIYQIPQLHYPTTVRGFLKSKGYSTQNLIELKAREDSILVNRQPVFVTHPLTEGDELQICIRETGVSEKITPVELPLDIVYEDQDLCVLNKPAGMPIHPSMHNYDNSLANGLAFYYAAQNKPFIFRCINRLDRDTSGLTIVAKHMVSAGILSAMVASKTGEQSIRREYLAICKGDVTPESGTITAPLSRKPGSVIERTVDFEKGERAVTHYRKIAYKNGHSLLSLCLETGRTHQIRIHMKYLGYPLIGDYLYNPDMEFINRQALHSHRLTFPHPITGEMLSFTAPLPQDMRRVLEL